MWVDGEPVASPGEPLSASELLSAELDQFGRDAVYEAAVRRSLRKPASPARSLRAEEELGRGGQAGAARRRTS